jgi:hypothetical protein
MLETELQALKTEVTLLREAISSLTATMIGVAHAALPATPVAPPAAAAEPDDLQKVEATKAQPITVESLQAFCVDMVRKDPDAKPKIKEIIASFDGAKTIGKVPADRLPDLKAALEALQ